mmetsp:Transcript_24848/g.75670  ORF Transcript_24848/g.75670 Transcript_24848/m.75670 type:complete len:178 (+) Transcript_24848:477-1010(+)
MVYVHSVAWSTRSGVSRVEGRLVSAPCTSCPLQCRHPQVLAGNLPTASVSTHPRGRRVDLSTSLFGVPVGLPFFTSPTAGNRMFHCEGEVAVASVAAEFEMLYSLSSFSTSTFEEIAQAHLRSNEPMSHNEPAFLGTLPRAFQLYVWRDRGFLREILARARAAGFEVCSSHVRWVGC